MNDRGRSKRNKHTNVSKDLKLFIERLDKIKLIKKVILGIAENARHKYSPGTAKFQKYTESGIAYKVYTGNGLIKVFICCAAENQKEVRKMISKGISDESSNT